MFDRETTQVKKARILEINIIQLSEQSIERQIEQLKTGVKIKTDETETTGRNILDY